MTWAEMRDYMVETFGVISDLTDNDPDDCVWFQCPECDEPILELDWALADVSCECPVCGCVWEEIE